MEANRVPPDATQRFAAGLQRARELGAPTVAFPADWMRTKTFREGFEFVLDAQDGCGGFTYRNHPKRGLQFVACAQPDGGHECQMPDSISPVRGEPDPVTLELEF